MSFFANYMTVLTQLLRSASVAQVDQVSESWKTNTIHEIFTFYVQIFSNELCALYYISSYVSRPLYAWLNNHEIYTIY